MRVDFGVPSQFSKEPMSTQNMRLFFTVAHVVCSSFV